MKSRRNDLIDPTLPRTTKPNSAASVVEQALRAFRLKKAAERYGAFPLWGEIVGSEIASVALPERISRGNILVIRVLDSSWAQELSSRKAELLAKLREANTGAIIEDLRFITGDPRVVRRVRNSV